MQYLDYLAYEESLKIPRWLRIGSERRTDNTINKRKREKKTNGLHNTTQKTKDWVKQTLQKLDVNSYISYVYVTTPIIIKKIGE